MERLLPPPEQLTEDERLDAEIALRFLDFIYGRPARDHQYGPGPHPLTLELASPFLTL